MGSCRAVKVLCLLLSMMCEVSEGFGAFQGYLQLLAYEHAGRGQSRKQEEQLAGSSCNPWLPWMKLDCPSSSAEKTGKTASKDDQLMEEMGKEGLKYQVGAVLGHKGRLTRRGTTVPREVGWKCSLDFRDYCGEGRVGMD